MWSWLIGGYAALVAMLIGCAGYVALFVGDPARSELAYKILKTALATATGGTGVVAVALHLSQLGLL